MTAWLNCREIISAERKKLEHILQDSLCLNFVRKTDSMAIGARRVLPRMVGKGTEEEGYRKRLAQLHVGRSGVTAQDVASAKIN